MTSTTTTGTMPLTQEKRLDAKFSNNNDHSYLHKKFKKMATTLAVFPQNLSKAETRQKESSITSNSCSGSISNGSITAAHPELEKIKEDQRYHFDAQVSDKNVQINYSNENCRISNVNNVVQVSGQTSFTEDFSNKTENLDNEFIRDNCNGSAGGRNICPYCKLSCAKPSVLQKHIRAHTNERPYPCVPCGFAFKTKSNLYKHRRSRTHALRLQGADVPLNMNEDDLSGGSESDTSIPPNAMSETGSDSSNLRFDNYERRFSPSVSPDSINENIISSVNTHLSNANENKSKSIYKPKFRAALYQEVNEKEKLKKANSHHADFLTEHISKIISDNEAIVDVIETPLQKKYGKIKQIAESKQFLNETNSISDIKSESSPLNLTKNSNDDDHPFRKRSHSESFSPVDHQKHPLNPEGSIIKDLLLKTKMNGLASLTGELIEGSLYVCPLCQIIFRSADNLETHRMFYCGKGNISNAAVNHQKDIKMKPENMYVRSNSINVRMPETHHLGKTNVAENSPPLRIKPENLIITKQESNDVIAPLPSPGPLLGNTRLVDTRGPSEYRKNEGLKSKPMQSPKRRIDSRSDTYSPRLVENVSPRTADLYTQSKIRCIDSTYTTAAIRAVEEMTQHMRHNSTALQMFGGEVKIVDHSGGTTTLRIEPNKNQLSPILIHQNLSPSKLANGSEASSVVVRSSLQSGGTIMHNPPTPKETLGTPQPQTPRITISTPGTSTPSLSHMHDRSHFQFPPLSAITAYNPLTLPPLSPSVSPNGATTIFHAGKLIPHVPGIPGPNTPGLYIAHQNTVSKNNIHSEVNKKPVTPSRDDFHGNPLHSGPHSKGALLNKYETQQLRNTRSPHLRVVNNETDKIITTPEPSDGLYGHPNYSPMPIIKVKNVDDTNPFPKMISPGSTKGMSRQEGALKRTADGMPRIPILKENNTYYSINKAKNRDKAHSPVIKTTEIKSDKETRNFNFENLITKAEIFNNQIPSSSEVQKNTNAQETPTTFQNERSETLYFQKNVSTKPGGEDRKPKFLRPSTLPLKPGTYTPKRHHGITPNANTMPLVSPETPRPAKAYGQLYLNGNAYTYLGLKCSTKVFYCTINRPQPTYVPNQHFLSMYSNWQLLSELTPDPLGLSASSAMSLYDSRHRPQSVARAVIKQDLILTHSSQWNKNSKENRQATQTTDMKKMEDSKCQIGDSAMTPKKELAGGFESNEEYTYVRGRGRGRYVCLECGIRCKKPSMLKKHIRTHTDVRPYTCVHCAFSFKTKGNLTKHMKSKAHYKKCCELGINPNEGNEDSGEMAACSGDSADDTDSDVDEGNDGETESSDTETCKSRLPEHEAAHCLLSLGSSRPAARGLLTSARPSTYPYTPAGPELASSPAAAARPSRTASLDSRPDAENEPMDLSKSDAKTPTPNIPEIPTARESSVLASLASNTAKLPQQHAPWTNGEPMLHTYLTERALLDSRIKQSQLATDIGKLRKLDLEASSFAETIKKEESNRMTQRETSPAARPPASTPQSVKDVITPTCTEADTQNTVVVSTDDNIVNAKDSSQSKTMTQELKRHTVSSNSNTENAKHVVSEYLKHARINHIKTHEDMLSGQNEGSAEAIARNLNLEDGAKIEELNLSDSESTKPPALEHEPVARKVVIGAGGVAFKVAKGKEFEGAAYSPGRLMEDGRRVCDFCNKTFTKPSQLRLHLNIHYMERPFRCGVCAVSFRTRGHLQKHERSGSHHNKVSMTSTFGAATSVNPRPFRCSDCNIAFRIHGHLAKHLRSKMHVMRLECLFKLPFGTFTEIERAGVSLTDIDTTDCASSLASLQALARQLHDKDPTKLEYREPAAPARDDYDNQGDTDKDTEMRNSEIAEGHEDETRVNYSATDI